jgi:hypothetical protein
MIYLAEALRNTGHNEHLYKTTTLQDNHRRRATPPGHPTAGW